MALSATHVSGECPSRFQDVREALRAAVVDGKEVGAAFAVTIDGELVIDLWAGHMDADRRRPWHRDTIVNLYSVGKAITAICLLQQIEVGAVEIDAPVARYWPEFAAAGKADLPVRFLLTHQAGLPAVAKALPAGTALDWDAMCAALAEQPPWWVPGMAHGYHTNTYGFLVGEVLRRVTGLSVGQYFRRHIAEPGGIDFMCGFGPEHDVRVADMLPSTNRPTDAPPPREMQRKGGVNPPELSGQGIVNSRSWRAAEVPATNGHGNAGALARLYGALAGAGSIDGVHILAPETIAMATREQVYGKDEMLGRVTRFGLGFQLAMRERPLGPNPGAFGHFGAGGSLGFADPEAGRDHCLVGSDWWQDRWCKRARRLDRYMALRLRAREDRLIPFERILLGWLEEAPAFPTQMERERRRSRSTCARSLKRLEKKGYVEGRWVHTHQGPPRRLYELTSDGCGVVRAEGI